MFLLSLNDVIMESVRFSNIKLFGKLSLIINRKLGEEKLINSVCFTGPDEVPGPVKWPRPYFDCGRSDKWLVPVVVPIVDIYPRHTGFRHIEYPT